MNWFKKKKITYPRVVVFENMLFAIEVTPKSFLDNRDSNIYCTWSIPRSVLKHCLFNSISVAYEILDEYEYQERLLNIKLNYKGA